MDSLRLRIVRPSIEARRHRTRKMGGVVLPCEIFRPAWRSHAGETAKARDTYLFPGVELGTNSLGVWILPRNLRECGQIFRVAKLERQ